MYSFAKASRVSFKLSTFIVFSFLFLILHPHHHSFISMISIDRFDRSSTPSSTRRSVRFGTPIAMGVTRFSAFFCSSTLMCFPNSLGMNTLRSANSLGVIPLDINRLQQLCATNCRYTENKNRGTRVNRRNRTNLPFFALPVFCFCTISLFHSGISSLTRGRKAASS